MYLIITSNPYSTKNKLQQAVQDELKSFDRLIIPTEDIEKAKAYFISKIERLNALNPNCRPIKASFYKTHTHNDWALSFGEQSIIMFQIKEIKGKLG